MIQSNNLSWDQLSLKLFRQLIETCMQEVRQVHLVSACSVMAGDRDMFQEQPRNFKEEKKFLISKMGKMNLKVFVTLDGETVSQMLLNDAINYPQADLNPKFDWWPTHFKTQDDCLNWLFETPAK